MSIYNVAQLDRFFKNNLASLARGDTNRLVHQLSKRRLNPSIRWLSIFVGICAELGHGIHYL